MELLHSSEDGVDLEGKAPSLRFFIVFLQHIDVLAVEVLPFSHRLFNPFGLRDFLSEDFKEGRFSTANVALNSVAIIGFGELRV